MLLWLAALGAMGVALFLLFLLFKAFPGVVSTPEDMAWAARYIGGMALLSTGLLVRRRTNLWQMAKHAAIWAGIILVLAIGVSYSNELLGVVQRVRGTFSPAYPVATGARELVVTRDAGGGFYLMGKVNGQIVRFLVDTGASDTVLSPADAKRLGIETAGLPFDQSAETANGTGYGATYDIASLELGAIRFTDVPAIINKAPMSSSLLGMSVLKRLESFQVKGDKLYLKARD